MQSDLKYKINSWCIKMKKTIKIILIILLVFAIICAGVYMFIWNKFSKMNVQNLRQEEAVSSPIPDTEPKEQKPESKKEVDFRENEDIINILLIGADNDYLPGMNSRGNADGIVIATLNKNTEKIIITSIMRDTRIKMPNGNSDKVTMIYHNHGMDTLMDSIENNFDIKLDNYLMVNYLNVVNIIDAAGGIMAQINEEDLPEFNKKLRNINGLVGVNADSDLLSSGQTGNILLNGRQAATYMRLRLTGGNDFGRTARVRHVLSELKTKLMDMNLRELNAFSDVVFENINTDLSAGDMMSLLGAAPKYMKYELVSSRIPIDDSYTGDGSYLYPDIEKNKEALHNIING